MIGNLTNGHVVHCGDLNAHSELRSGISYKMAHKRVATRRGSAKRYECIDCKQPAEEWSYRGGAPDELIGESNRARNLPYSPTPSYYDPRCKACHTAYDSN
ncbi:hypothetical protein [Streptomyces mirabilis]|uniref:hypothetical protein n=1 Tax=Streptomyces mirabilis TaxID=68239 RepID=UPI0036A28766